MSVLSKKLDYLKETCEILRTNVGNKLGLTLEDVSLRRLCERVADIDQYKSALTYLPKGTVVNTPFGEYTTSFDYCDIVITPECIGKSITAWKLAAGSSNLIDYSYNNIHKSLVWQRISSNHSVYYAPRHINPRYVIYPDTVIGCGVGHLTFTNELSNLHLYLPRKWQNSYSGWIIVATLFTRSDGSSYVNDTGGMLKNNADVRCPPETCSSYIYLQALNMSATTMVNLFGNLKDVSTDTNTYTVSIGSTNLAKLTDEQKAIATGKGWILS